MLALVCFGNGNLEVLTNFSGFFADGVTTTHKQALLQKKGAKSAFDFLVSGWLAGYFV
jgi:succinate dehydrogenase/fumarate reductase flavoprotein subunit